MWLRTFSGIWSSVPEERSLFKYISINYWSPGNESKSNARNFIFIESSSENCICLCTFGILVKSTWTHYWTIWTQFPFSKAIPFIPLYSSRTALPPRSSVGIATGYGLDGLGIESSWGRDFPHQSRPALRPTQPPVQWAAGFFSRGEKRPGREADSLHPSSAVVMNE
jgi:hypothetical protein